MRRGLWLWPELVSMRMWKGEGKETAPRALSWRSLGAKVAQGAARAGPSNMIEGECECECEWDWARGYAVGCVCVCNQRGGRWSPKALEGGREMVTDAPRGHCRPGGQKRSLGMCLQRRASARVRLRMGAQTRESIQAKELVWRAKSYSRNRFRGRRRRRNWVTRLGGQSRRRIR